jgi:DNA-binding response OmpR family regulator
MDENIRIILIENDPEIIDSLVITLKIRWPKAEVVFTDSGEKGIELIASRSFDVCILDLGLPISAALKCLRVCACFPPCR